MSLEALKAALARGSLQDGLELALTAWRANRHPAIADVIDALSTELLKRYPEPRFSTNAAWQKHWKTLARAPSATDVGWLAKTLTVHLPIGSEPFGQPRNDYATVKYAAWFERLELLASFPADPRVGTALARVLVDPQFIVFDLPRTRTVYEPMLPLLADHGDVRSLPALEAQAANPQARQAVLREMQKALLPAAIASLRKQATRSLPDDAAWSSLAATHRKRDTATDADALFKQILANPDDDSLRLVYADLLLEREDPRGEFISLQIAEAQGTATKKQVTRARALLKAHKSDWLGPLDRVLMVDFARGFPAHAKLRDELKTTPEMWEAAIADPRLGTLETLERHGAMPAKFERFLKSERLLNLKQASLHAVSAVLLLQKAHFAPRLQTIGINRGDLPGVARLNLPSLRSVLVQMEYAFDALVLEEFRGAEWFSHLKEVVFEINRLHRMPDISPIASAAWKALNLDRLKVTHGHQFERIGKGVRYSFSQWASDGALRVLKDPPMPLTEVVLRSTDRGSSPWSQLKEAANAVGATLELVPHGLEPSLR